MNRNYYCKVNSQEEADELLDKLKSIGEPINKLNFISISWYKIGYDTGTWSLLTQSHISRIKNATEVPASELIDYVTGKKLNKDALLEEAKRRYPIGTKFKSALKGDKHPFQTIVKENIYLDKVDGRQVIWNGDGCGFIYDDENWAEILEKPKVEPKFEVGKWYKNIGFSKEYIGKLDRIESEEFWVTEYIYRDKWGKDNAYFVFFSDVQEVSLEEIQQYLPADHPDKIKQEVKEEVKPIERWSVESYVVFLKDYGGHSKGTIDIIKNTGKHFITVKNCFFNSGDDECNLYKDTECEWFPTLQEAQKFSDELLGKSKTGLRVEDLVEGEIYVNGPDNGTMWCYIIKYSKNSFKKAVGLYKTGVYSAEYCNYMGDYTEGWLLRLATPDEKKWLNTCIKQDKFIEQSELDKYDNEGNLMEKNEEYPEYVKLINTGGCIGEAPIINRIYKLVKDNRGNYQYEFLLDNVYKFGFDDRNGEFTKYFEPSTKEDYDAQFKKDEDYKVGDWVVVLDTPNIRKWDKGTRAIGYVFQIREDKDYYKVFIKGEGSAIDPINKYGINYKLEDVRKALPHEIPVENSVKQYPYTPEESIKLDFEVKWKEPRYIGGVDPISAFSCGIFEQMKKQSPQSRKTPDLIDKSKVKVEIKRTKVKQIKL